MTPTPQLRSMSISDMLDAAFRLYRQHFLTFVGIVALLQVPMAIIQFAAQLPYTQALLNVSTGSRVVTPGSNPFDFSSVTQLLPYYAIIFGLSIVQYLLIYNLIAGALANAISQVYLGRPISILSAYKFGLKRFLSLLGASLVPFLIGVLFVGLIAGCSFGALTMLSSRGGGQPNIGAAVGIVFALIAIALVGGIVWLFFYVRLLLSTQAIVLEERSAFAGLARSWRLVGQSFWRSLGIVLLVYAFIYVVAIVVQLPLTAILLFASSMAQANYVLTQAISSLVTYSVLILTLPLQFIIFTLLYYDLRIRKEGYDLELRAQMQPADGL